MDQQRSGDKQRETADEGTVLPPCNPDYVRMVKLAAAVAILRTKPPGMTGQQYTQYLQHKYQANQGDWKKRAKLLQSHLLQTRQELLQAKLLQQQPQPAEGDEDKPEQVFPTPPSSSEQPSSPQVSREDVVQRHSRFLSCVLRLQTVRNSLAGRVNLEETVKDSILDSLHLLKVSVEEKVPDVSMATKKHVVKTIVEVLGREELKEFSEEIVRSVMDLVQTILTGVLRCEDLNRHQHQENQCRLIVDLSEAEALQKLILETLLQNIKDFSDTLRTVKTSSLDPVLYENVYYMFWTFEQILYNLNDCRKQSIDETLANELNNTLESSLLFISEKYPLFAHYVWKLGGVLNSIQTLR
ncbi:PREDICTED: meiosis-specific protein MEI4-like [Branchiostoma belcheri]|uniref:Meiosis-specific protein MEI4-like n=1 Tax=Branchiostoma belcheri TaxID=7741 RepID=A0A6P5A0H1_BRABE|nr:PREDICTED: meiosis-specific protein MEI4-like [Branchiostoma belcheri]